MEVDGDVRLRGLHGPGAARLRHEHVGGDEAGERRVELFGIDGLAEVGVASHGEAALSFFADRVRRQRDDGEAHAEGAQLPRRFVAIHDGHLHIEQDGVEVSALSHGRVHPVEGLHAVRGFFGVDARALHQEAQDAVVVGAVVDAEDARAAQRRMWIGEAAAGLRGASRRGWAQRQLIAGAEIGAHGEGGAFAHRRLDGDVAAQEPREGARDGEAQARAAVLAVAVGVRLAERQEERRHSIGWDADARVAHRDEQGAACGRFWRFDADDDVDAAAFGELERVADEVEEDLLETRGIRAEGQRHLGRQAHHELHALGVGARLHGRDDVLQQHAQILIADAQIELARLDAREIEDVVQQREQVLAVAAQVRSELGVALGRRIHLLQVIRVAEDGADGIADLVGEIRHELALEAARRLGAREGA